MQRLEPFLSADTPVADNFPSAGQSDRRSVLLPLLLSLIAHAALLGLFAIFAAMPRTLVEPDAMRRAVEIRLVPIQQTAETADVALADQQPTEQTVDEPAAEAADTEQLDETLAEPSVVEIASPTDAAPEPVDEPAEELLPPPVVVPVIDQTLRNALRLPPASELRQLLKEISDAQNAMSLAECSRLQQENPLISCGAEDNKDLPELDRNFVYDYSNPRNESRRSAASVNIIAAQTPAVQERMRSAGVNAALRDFLLYQQNISDEDYRGTAPRPEKRLTDVLNMNNRTWQMIKKSMGE